MNPDLFDDAPDDKDTLTADEAEDVRQSAYHTLVAVEGDDRYDDTIALWHRQATGPQVFVMPLRPRRQSWGTSDAYGTVALPGRQDH